MANTKSKSSPKGSVGRPTSARRSTKVVDPMMVSPVKARRNDRKLADVAIDNGVEFDTDDSFVNGESLYNIDDLYDDDGNLLLDEADEVLREEESIGRRVTKQSAVNTALNSRNEKKNTVKNDEDLDLSEEELEDELLKRKSGKAAKLSRKAEKRRKKAEKKARRRTPLWAKIVIFILVLIMIKLTIVCLFATGETEIVLLLCAGIVQNL